VTFSTVLGDDELKDFAIDDLRSADIEVRAIVDRSRPTVSKNAIVVGGYRLLKVDTLDNRSISDQILGEMIDAVQKVPTDAVVFADFRHGIFIGAPSLSWWQALPAVVSVSPTARLQPLGQYHRFSRLRSHHADEREARFALAIRIPAFGPLPPLSMMQHGASF